MYMNMSSSAILNIMSYLINRAAYEAVMRTGIDVLHFSSQLHEKLHVTAMQADVFFMQTPQKAFSHF